MKKLLKKFIPHESMIKDHLGDTYLSKTLQSSKCMQVNLRSVSRGVAIGLFFAFLPLPLQMLLAALSASYLKGNIIIAMAMTWVTNPLTFLPFNYLIFTVGHFITRNEESFHQINTINFSVIYNAHVIDQMWAWLNQAGISFLVGLPIVAVSAACLGYLLIQTIWRVHISYRMYLRRR